MSVKGFDRAIAKVDALLALMSDAPQEAAREWLEQDFKPLAKQLAPVRTGELRDSIDGEVTPGGVRVFASAPYAKLVEEGTSKQAAQPFLTPAFERTKHKLKERIDKKIKKGSR